MLEIVLSEHNSFRAWPSLWGASLGEYNMFTVRASAAAGRC